MKRLEITKKELLTVPNLLTLIRLLSVPVYMTLIILGGLNNSHPQWFVYVGLGVMIFAASTDVFDGYIARKYNQGSYIGQLIDPIADKAMHIGCIVALIVVGYIHWAFVIFLVFRELCMVVVGSFVVNDVDVKANMLGKVASAILSVGMITCFFHPFIAKLWGEYGIDWIIITIGLVLNWAAAINYGVWTAQQIKLNKQKEATEDTENAASENTENAEEQNNDINVTAEENKEQEVQE